MTITARIAHIKNNALRRTIWMVWSPLLTLQMISEFAYSPNLRTIVITANKLGWNGVSNAGAMTS
jgi:hypothetical protein